MANPAIGARGQIGFSQEGVWGKKQPAPKFFIEFTNESVVSELGALVSASLRSDRAVHKRIGGVESAGGDVNFEVSAEGYGKIFKHALGSVQTTRLDHAFVMKVIDAAATSVKLTVTKNATTHLATNFAAVFVGGTGTGVDIALGDSTADTIQELMDLINAAGTGLAAYSVSSYQGDSTGTTILDADYANGTDNSNLLEAVGGVELIQNAAGDKDWLVSFGWGVYQHVIDANATLPEGMTVEIGRDVAAFTYAGCKVNTLTLTADTGEILGGTFGIMAKGGTTASRAVGASANTIFAKDAFSIRYTGEGATCTFQIDKTNHQVIIESATASEDLKLDISVPWTDPATGRVYALHTVGGLTEYLNSLSYITATLLSYCNWDEDASYLAAAGPTDINVASAVTFKFDTADISGQPATWGDYIGADSGIAAEILCDIVGAGVPGVATIRFSNDAGLTYGETYTTSATVPTEVRVASNVDTGFTIFFPDSASIPADNVFTISTFKDEETGATYSTLDPFAGFDGALTIDGTEQPIMSWNCTLNNNLFAEKYHLGSRTRASLPEQRRSVEGTVGVEFDNLDLYRRFVNGTEGNLVMTFTSDTYIDGAGSLGDSRSQYSLAIRQPDIEFNGATPVISDEGIITVDMPYVALYDDVNSIPELRITLVNNESYL